MLPDSSPSLPEPDSALLRGLDDGVLPSLEEAAELAEDTGDPDALTELEEKILALEKRRWRYQGSKEQAIKNQLGLGPTRYYQILNALLDDPRALKKEKQLVERLQMRRG